MKLLIIGDALSPYTVAFSRFLKQHTSTITLDIINTRPNVSDVELTEQVRGAYDQFYTSQTITTVVDQVNQNIYQYNVICLHGFWDIVLSIYDSLNHKKIFTAGVVWGSDFYRRDHSAMPLSSIFDRCDRVLVQTDEMKTDLLEIYPLPTTKIRKCLFGIEPLESLTAMKDISPAKAKRCLGLPANTFVITCGYNGSPFQNHVTIINQLTSIISRLPANSVLIFPFTYQKNIGYMSFIQGLLKKSPLTYYFIENFMDSEQVSVLCLATDIFIQIQTTDALSASMREHLFARSIVITGGWLPYQVLVRDGIYFETIEALDSLGAKITDILDTYSEVKRNVELHNTSDKFEQYRWPNVIQQWYEVFLEYKTEKND